MGGDIQIRGTGILGPVKGLRVHRQQALERLPDHLYRYLTDQIDLEAWYPLADHLELSRTLIELLPIDGDPWEWLGQLTASFDLIEVYPLIVQRNDPPATLLKMPEMWKLYHDVGLLTVTLSGSSEARIELTGVPSTREEYCRALTGYFSEAVRLAGGVDVETQCVHRDETSAEWTARW